MLLLGGISIRKDLGKGAFTCLGSLIVNATFERYVVSSTFNVTDVVSNRVRSLSSILFLGELSKA